MGRSEARQAAVSALSSPACRSASTLTTVPVALTLKAMVRMMGLPGADIGVLPEWWRRPRAARTGWRSGEVLGESAGALLGGEHGCADRWAVLAGVGGA